jgi:hypothetical protein
MSKPKFSPRQLLFLELFFSGYSMQDAARGAGYKGSSPQALCNTGRVILDKFSKTPWAWSCKRKVAQTLFDVADNMPEFQKLKALKFLLAE